MIKNILAIAFISLWAACSGDKEPKAIVLELSAGDDMRFSTDKLEAPAGAQITLKLKHTGKMAKKTMGHNVVVLQSSADVAGFATAAVAAGLDADHIPADKKSDIVAHTKLIGGGEVTEIKFTAPPAGKYPFICSFPGHYGLMKGTLTTK